MTFKAKFGGVTTKTPWNRPTKEAIRKWRDTLSFSLDDWYIVGNVVEEFSDTWDVDIMLIQKPLKTPLNELSLQFKEMITKGFKHKLLIDCAFMPEFYQDEWQPISKIRPDDRFYKELNGEISNPIYTADDKERIGPQLWFFKYKKPHDNWNKGKDRGYNFTGIPLKEY